LRLLRWFDGKKLLLLLVYGILILIFSSLFLITYPYFKELFSFLWRLFIPFLIAAFFAYLLFPVISFLDRQQIHKGLAVLIIYILFFGGIGFFVYRVYPQIIHQMRDLVENLPEFVGMYEDLIQSVYNYTSFLPETVHDRIDEAIIRLEATLEGLLSKLVNGFLHLFDMIVIITVIPVLVFYYIKDYQLFKTSVKRFIPERLHPRMSRLITSIDEGLGGYIRGQFIVCFFVALLTFVVFQWLEVPYALLLSTLMGLTNIIPYFGPIIGAIPAVLIAYTTSPHLVLYVVITIFAIQLIEGNFLSPYVVGKSISIHPVVIIFVLLLGGELFGILGMILAVPTVAVLKVLIRHLPNLLLSD
jgi:predicted PurR-regulated permease PerM